jgi:hypothetical protein
MSARPWKKRGHKLRRVQRQLAAAQAACVDARTDLSGFQTSTSAVIKRARERVTYTENQLLLVYDILRRIVRYSAAAPPLEIDAEPRLEHHIMVEESPFMLADPHVIGNASTGIRVVDVHALTAFVERNYMKMTSAIHVVLGQGRAESVYMLSDEALRALPPGMIAEHLVPAITRQLISHLQGRI